MISPESSQQLEFTGEATEAGTLIIRGCIIQAAGCASREFCFLAALSEHKHVLSQRREVLEREERIKHHQLSSRLESLKGIAQPSSFTSIAQSSFNVESSQFLQLKVIPIQPLLRIRRTSLTHGAVMLYSGER